LEESGTGFKDYWKVAPNFQEAMDSDPKNILKHHAIKKKKMEILKHRVMIQLIKSSNS